MTHNRCGGQLNQNFIMKTNQSTDSVFSAENETSHSDYARLPAVKLTKVALNNFIMWTSTRYNDWLGYGTKKQNVEDVFKALNEGHFKGKKIFTIKCAGPAGENPQRGRGRSWRTKTAGDTYTIDCELKTITTEYSGRSIRFA